jgi:hypothetical protein
MITKLPPLSERAEYIHLTVHDDKDLAELSFVRPAGSRISVMIPLNQLKELYEDIADKYAAEIRAPRQKK